MEKFALIVAGGSGSRMGSDIPKQFLLLNGKPTLMHTIERFKNYDDSIQICLVLPEAQFSYWENLCTQHHFSIPHKLTAGGNTRFQSVKNGLNKLPNSGIVFIHDGVRPLVSNQTISNCEKTALKSGNALPVTPVIESIREISTTGSKHADRNNFRLVQTPQTFKIDLIKQAFEQEESSFFTDDASVCEAMGVTINLVEGNPENIKITQPSDLKIAEFLLSSLV
ncbi:2-C-methyl-D-erythritol 4-phosphate cytidylyltransferase [Mangrovibacterium lignilyticum]|uniref:2-C-methyl-D-erythritol 4-phosphate cytidylyltransferase n=1 Tax=Mangrovibacterium lignilyticum TaxID=2668052 RepID=UPI0013D4A686|nr:2-C-methyl-D-erythritol 4-phosphate cytidylyltransferase [Mangrovibacterium lignilyticum]